MKEKHLIVVSVDALVFEDLEFAKTLPSFKKLFDGASVIQKLKTVYPSLTHPVHATILTGCNPGKTGIVNNELFGIGTQPKLWYNWLSQIKCDTILHAAKRAGITTAVSRWPVTAGDDGIVDYLIPEFFAYYADGYDDPVDAYEKIGACKELRDILDSAIKKYTITNEHPVYDEFQIECASKIIKNFKPGLLLTHPGNVDSARHCTGLFGDGVNNAIRLVDKWLGMLFDAVREAGIEDTTDFVVMSDHGHLSITRSICPNVFLADKGYITLDNDGNITDWKAYVMSAGLSAQVYLSKPDNKQLYDEVYSLLKDMAEEKIYGFESVFTIDEVKEKYGLDGDFSFVIETDGFTSFNQDHIRPVVRDIDISDYRYGHSTHGHMPEKGPQPTFIAKGPSFKKNAVIENSDMINIAPTLAAVLGITLPDADGKAVTDIISDCKK